jgi:hypothetical protein
MLVLVISFGNAILSLHEQTNHINIANIVHVQTTYVINNS